jgi:glycosyltransferase involved in cell wall biosynthesis
VPAEPRVTVVVTAYDQEAFLAEALASVAAQTLEDWDVVLADDASTDGSAGLLRAWAERCGHRAALVLHERNTGLNPMLNEVLGHCRGRYLAYLGGDDVWAPAKLERLVAALEATPEAAFAYSDARMVDESGGEVAPSFLDAHDESPGPDGHVFDDLLRRNFVVASTVVYRRDAIEAVGAWNPDLPFEDWDLLLRLADRAPAVHVPEVLADYRVHAASATRSRFSIMLEGRLAVLEPWLGRHPDHDEAILGYLRYQSWRLYKVHPDRGRAHVAVAYRGARAPTGRLRYLVATRPGVEAAFERLRRIWRLRLRLRP